MKEFIKAENIPSWPHSIESRCIDYEAAGNEFDGSSTTSKRLFKSRKRREERAEWEHMHPAATAPFRPE